MRSCENRRIHWKLKCLHHHFLTVITLSLSSPSLPHSLLPFPLLSCLEVSDGAGVSTFHLELLHCYVLDVISLVRTVYCATGTTISHKPQYM